MLLLDGKKVAEDIKFKLTKEIQQLSVKPCLAIIQIGDDERSGIYIKHKKKFGEVIGASVFHLKLPETTSQSEIEGKIQELNQDENVHGIIIQLPIPKHLEKEKLVNMVVPVKDVDGLVDQGTVHTPATARGVMTLLAAYEIEARNKKVVVIGRSRLVGGPIVECLRRAGAEVETCNKETKNIPEITKQADIIVVAAGSPHFITKDYVKEGQVIVDVGINPVTGEEDGLSYTVGDVDFPEVSIIVKAISPVPGGVGPLTVASLFQNLFDAIMAGHYK